MSKIQVSMHHENRNLDGPERDGFDQVGDTVYRVWSNYYRPRIPGDGCGCERVRLADGAHAVELCPKHSREPGIAKFCLKPPRRTLDPRLTP